MPTLFVIDRSLVTFSGGALESTTNGSDWIGEELTFDNAGWAGVEVSDANSTFESGVSTQQELTSATTLGTSSYAAGDSIDPSFTITVTDGTDTWTLAAVNIDPVQGSGGSTIEGFAVIGGPDAFPPTSVALEVTSASAGAPASSDYADYAEDTVVDGTGNDDVIDGSYTDADGNTVTGGDDTIVAGAGEDTVAAGGGDDTIYGDGNLLINGGLEAGVADGTFVQNFDQPGWSTDGPGIETWGDTFNTVDAYEGSNFIEIDRASGVDNIYQDVDTTAGETYEISFVAQPRTNTNTNDFEVYFGGVLIDTIRPPTQGEWTEYTYTVTGSGGSERLEFVELSGQSSGQGAFIDDVRLEAVADDTLDGGAGNDTIFGGGGDDTITGGADDDTLYGESGDDTFVLEDGFGTDVIDGAEDGETTGDVLDASGTTQDYVLDLTQGDAADPESGTLSGNGDDATFANIEQIMLGEGQDVALGSDGNDQIDLGEGADTVTGGAGDDVIGLGQDADGSTDNETDTVILADGFGDDTITDVDAPIDNGDGTFTGVDTLDVSGMTDVDGNPVHISDVAVLDDGNGNLMIGFPSGDTVTLEGVPAASGLDPAFLMALGIPGDGIVQGTAGDDVIDASYLGDPDGDQVDNNDELLSGEAAQDDIILAGAGDDTVTAGAGDDEIYGDRTIENLIVNGSFEDLTGTVDTVWGDQGTGSITGWTSTDPNGEFDLHDNGKGGTFATDGTHVLDTGGTPANLNFYQDVQGTIDGESYTLSLDAGDMDFNPNNSVEIYWNGELIDTITPDGGTMQPYSYQLTGGSGDGSGRLQFVETGPEDVNGLQLDNIQLIGPVETAAGDDTIDGGAGDDEIYGQGGSDTIDGGAGADVIDGGADDDTITFGGGDTVDGGAGDDVFIYDAADTTPGTATVVGSETAEDLSDPTNGGAGDVLDMTAVTEDTTLVFSGAEAGDINGASTDVDFSEIEQVNLGSGDDTVTGSGADDSVDLGEGADTVDAGAGNDTIGLGQDPDGTPDGDADVVVLTDGFGDDTITDVDAPIDNGDGTFTGIDTLDVTGLNDADGNPVHVSDVTVTADPLGNAILTFPNGESVTLVGIPAADANDPAYLNALGIPGDGIVSGTAGNDVIDGSYSGDPEGDFVDNGDAILPGENGDDDIIEAGAGDDTVTAGAGNDEVSAGTGDDTVDGGAGADVLDGEAGSDVLDGGTGNDILDGGADDDTLFGGTGNDSLSGGAGDDIFVLGDGFGTDGITGGETAEDLSDPTNGDQGDQIDASSMTTDTVLDISSPEAGTLTSGGNTATFAEIEDVHLGSGDDTVTGSTGDDSVDLGEGADTIDAGAGNDTIGLGQDPDGTPDGDADVVTFSDGDGNDTILDFDGPIDNGDGTFTGIDTFDVSNLTDADGNPVDTSDVVVSDDGSGNALLTFPNGETITLVGIAPTDVDTAPELNAIGIPCFTPGTMITTAQGLRPVETLAPGDLVLTRDNGVQRVRWVGQRYLNSHQMAATPDLQPIRIKAGALGHNLPSRDMMVSPQHKMLLSDIRAEMLFGEHEVLVAALHLTDLPGVERMKVEDVTYIHIMFEDHEIIMAEGAWTESYQPGPHVLGNMDAAQREELMMIFPELRDNPSVMQAARMTLKAREATALLH